MRRDVYQEITNRVIAQLETVRPGEFAMPWVSTGAGLPQSIAKRAYRGIAVSRALNFTFCVIERGPSRGSSYADTDWRWESIADGRNTFRAMIESAVKSATPDPIAA